MEKAESQGETLVNPLTVHAAIALMLTATLASGMAANPAIGFAMARGSFRLDNATVSRNGTLFDGTLIETAQVLSELQLQGGVRIELAPGSRGTVYRDRLVLERGQGQLAGTAYQIEGNKIRVNAAAAYSSARVALEGTNRVVVAALGGPVRVTNGEGVLLANIHPGKALEFEPQAGAAAPTKMTGTLEKRDGHFLLTDETTGVTVELQGPGLDRNVGKRVEITGSTVIGAQAAAGAGQVIRVTAVTVLAAAGTAAAAGAAGVAVATKAIIAGVIIAGASTGVAVGVTRAEEKLESVSR